MRACFLNLKETSFQIKQFILITNKLFFDYWKFRYLKYKNTRWGLLLRVGEVRPSTKSNLIFGVCATISYLIILCNKNWRSMITTELCSIWHINAVLCNRGTIGIYPFPQFANIFFLRIPVILELISSNLNIKQNKN